MNNSIGVVVVAVVVVVEVVIAVAVAVVVVVASAPRPRVLCWSSTRPRHQIGGHPEPGQTSRVNPELVLVV